MRRHNESRWSSSSAAAAVAAAVVLSAALQQIAYSYKPSSTSMHRLHYAHKKRMMKSADEKLA